MLLFSALFVMLFFLSGCDGNGYVDMPEAGYYYQEQGQNHEDYQYTYNHCNCGEYYAHEVIQPSALSINVHDSAEGELLKNFDNIHTFTYLEIETEHYATLTFWADTPIWDLTFMMLGQDYKYFYVEEILFTINALLPSEAFVLNVAFDNCPISRGGLAFIEDNGARRAMFIQENMCGGCHPRFSLVCGEDLMKRCECGWAFAHETMRRPTWPINIHDPNDGELLRDFDTIHTFTYIEWEMDWYTPLIFWTDKTVRDFSFVTLGHVPMEGYNQFYVEEILFTIDELSPTDAFVLNAAFAHYLIPRGGLMFVDENDEQRFMFIWESMRGGCFPWFGISFDDSILKERPY